MSEVPQEVRELVRPQNSWWFTWILEKVRKEFWITINGKIYHPSKYDVGNNLKDYKDWRRVLKHEMVHIEQQKQEPFWRYAVKYLLLPFPIFRARFRWEYEREAFLVDLKGAPKQHRAAVLERILKSLGGSFYGWAWPKDKMRKWFEEELAKLED
jgi:hypothetical protein